MNTARRRALMLATAGLGGLLYGIDLGIIASALPYLEATLQLSPAELSLVVASVLLGCVLATLGAGPLCDRFGRRPVMTASGAAFVASIPLIAGADGFAVLMAGRLLQGASAGMIGVAVPLYLAESLGAANRGKGVGLFQWLLTLGILAAALIGIAFSLQVEAAAKTGDAAALLTSKDHAWRSIFWTALPPGILFLLGTLFLGESPRWLLRRGRVDDARAVLLRIREPAAAEAELAQMADTTAAPADAPMAARDSLWQRRYLHPFALACLVLACNQLTGVNSIVGYNTTILLQGGLDDVQAHLGYVIFNTIGCLVTGVALLLVDRKGRTFLLSLGTAGIVVTLGLVGLLFRQSEAAGVDCRQQLQSLVAYDRLELRFDQALSNRLLAGRPGGDQPTTLVVIHSFGAFRAASTPRRSDDAHARPLVIERAKDMPASAVTAFLANPLGDLEAARKAPLVIERATITPVPGVANGWLTATCLCLFKAFFAIGPGVCVWITLSELMPTRIRSTGMSIALLGNHAISTTIAALFLPTVGSHGYGAVFLAFAGFTTIYFIIARFFLPETKGRTLEEIERSFARRAAA
jgi:SP family myo-inositol transporter-like MFS transporter 13